MRADFFWDIAKRCTSSLAGLLEIPSSEPSNLQNARNVVEQLSAQVLGLGTPRDMGIQLLVAANVLAMKDLWYDIARRGRWERGVWGARRMNGRLPLYCDFNCGEERALELWYPLCLSINMEECAANVQNVGAGMEVFLYENEESTCGRESWWGYPGNLEWQNKGGWWGRIRRDQEGVMVPRESVSQGGCDDYHL